MHFVLLLAAPGTTFAQSIDVHVAGPRPLADAVRVVAQQGEWLVSYEDVPILAAVPISPGGAIRASIDLSAGPEAALAQLVASHHAAGNPGIFAVAKDGRRYSVVPTSTRGEDGARVAVSAVLDTRVTIPGGTRPVSLAIGEVTQAIRKATGVNVGVAGVMNHDFELVHTSVAAVDEPARVVLGRILDSITYRDYVWHLFGVPGDPDLMLNLRPVREPSPRVEDLPEAPPPPF